MIRTHNCGALRSTDIGKTVTLAGWINRRRDHGGVIFLDLRDRWGMTQLVVDAQVQKRLNRIDRVRPEYVVLAEGRVRKRPEGLENPRLQTGEVEVEVKEFRILSEAKLPPFELESTKETDEGLRLQYRYLDLRRSRMQHNLRFRHQVTRVIREYLSDLEFIEVETPFLTKSTPEGARDFLVPCRLAPRRFYALPQSPQLFKQILMVGGVDRYFQVVKCFRDEDLRADRQPEFTQVDIEMSFVEAGDVLTLVEGMISAVLEQALNQEAKVPFPRLSYHECLTRYGTDKPDLRIPLVMEDLTQLAVSEHASPLWPAKIPDDFMLSVLPLPGWKGFSRKVGDDLAALARHRGVALSWVRNEANEPSSPLKNKLSKQGWDTLTGHLQAKGNGIALVSWGNKEKVREFLGEQRKERGRELFGEPEGFSFCWVVDFPLFEWNEEERRWDSMHHPFTAPHPSDLERLETETPRVRAQSYDLVLNGFEVGGGSVRIYDPVVQEKIFRLLQLSEEEIQRKFGFFVESLQYGCPPHGGIALGLDRLVMALCGETSIREVIAFPKTQKGTCLLTGAPSPVEMEQLTPLGMRLKNET